MASLNVSMPEELREFVDERTKKGKFSTPSEYVRQLIRQDHNKGLQEVVWVEDGVRRSGKAHGTRV